MAILMGISNAAAIAMCDSLVDRVDGGASAGKCRIYSGTRAADVDTAIGAQVLLAELTFSDPAFGAAADIAPGARATASAITSDTSADASGTATWFRVLDSNNLAVWDGNVGTSDADLILNSVAISAGASVAITSFTVTIPES